MLFGAAYYHEYQPFERLEQDVALMRDCSFSVVRVGESSWSSWEPSDNRFDLKWMERILDALHKANIGAILGTPTYAIPPWLARKYPEIMAERRTGEPIPYGGRQNVDFSHPAFRFYAERIIREIVGAFAEHPAVIGYQLDNETGLELLYNRGVFEGFVEYLQSRYESVTEVNQRWGLTYWSHRLSSWADLWRPDGNTVPGYDLEWRRYQATLTREFLSWQASLVKSLARPDQFVTQCFVGGHGRPAADRFLAGMALDVASENPYFAMQDQMTLPDVEGESLSGGVPSFCLETGVWSVFMKADMAWATRQQNFIVTETNALSIGLSHENFPAWDGQWRLIAYALVARGAQGVCYWHFHTSHTGREIYWQGILNHDLEPNRCYWELARVGEEFGALGSVIDGLKPDANVGLIYSYDSRYALAFQPPLRVPNSGRPDERSYERIFNAYYRAFFEAGAQLRIFSEDDAWDAMNIVVVPALYICKDDVAERMLDYAHSGGHLVLSFRSGYANGDGGARANTAPGLFRDAVGASYQEYANVTRCVPVDVGGGVEDGARMGGCEWVDGLIADEATVIAGYKHPHYGRFAGATTHEFGSGRVTYVGTMPTPAFGRWLAGEVLGYSGVRVGWPGQCESVRVDSALTSDGRRLWFVGNWSWTVTDVPAAMDLEDALSAGQFGLGENVPLGPWEVRILLESEPDGVRQG